MIETAQRELQTSGAEHLIPGPATDHPAQLCSLTVMEGEGAFQFNKGQQATSISAAAGERRHPGGSCDAPFHLPQTLSRGLSKDRSELGPYEDLPHEFLRRQCEFTDRTKSFLRRYAHERPTLEHSDGSRSYYIPLHGITYRGLPNNNTDRVKFFRTTMELTVPPDAHNLDQCTFRRGPRVEETQEEFQCELSREVSGSMTLRPSNGPLNFFTHGCFSGAGVTDADAVRLAMLTGTPTVTIDWRSTQGPWYTLPFRYVVDYNSAVSQEPAFEKALDQSLKAIDPSHVTMVSFSRGAAFNAAYMKHRYAENLRPLNGHVMAHADLNTSAFSDRNNGVNPITAASDATVVLGNRHDKVLFFSRWRIFGDRVGDANKSDIDTVTRAGARYVIDDIQRKGGNFNHYVNYNLISRILSSMSESKKHLAITGDITTPTLEIPAIPER